MTLLPFAAGQASVSGLGKPEKKHYKTVEASFPNNTANPLMLQETAVPLGSANGLSGP